jgi:hypothetical protein
MSKQSSVGNSQVYEAGDQRNVPQPEIEQAKKENRFHEGKEHSHKALDSSKASQKPYQNPILMKIPRRGREIDRQQAGSRGEG